MVILRYTFGTLFGSDGCLKIMLAFPLLCYVFTSQPKMALCSLKGARCFCFFIVQASECISYITLADTKGVKTSKKKKTHKKRKEQKKTSSSSAASSIDAPTLKKIIEKHDEVSHMMSIVILLNLFLVPFNQHIVQVQHKFQYLLRCILTFSRI